MTEADRYVKLVEWSDGDRCCIGRCPELIYGGCHGGNARSVFAEFCRIVDETLEIYRTEGRPLPVPRSGRQCVNALQQVA
jgi:hypothetical protein